MTHAPSQLPWLDKLQERIRALPRPAKVAALIGGVLLAVLLFTTLFGEEVFVRVSPFRIRVLSGRVHQGEQLSISWTVSRTNRQRFPFERVYACPVRLGRTITKACALVLAATPNDGQERVTIASRPGVYRILLQALDRNRRPIRGIRLTSNGFRVLPRLAEEGGGGGDGSGSGGGGGAPPTQVALIPVPNISYVDTTDGTLNVATRGSWNVTTVLADILTAGPGKTALAVDGSGAIHLALRAKGDLWYATNASGTWATTVVDVLDPLWPSLAVDSAGKAHIAYHVSSGPDSGLRYATNASGSWTQLTVDATAQQVLNTSIATDPQRVIHIVYGQTRAPSGGAGRGLYYLANTGGTWVARQLLATGTSGQESSVAVDGQGKIHVAYYDGRIMYGTNASGSFVAEPVTARVPGSLHTVIALDGNGKAHIAYQDNGQEDALYATNASGQWISERIDPAAGSKVGLYMGLAVDRDGYPHVSYYDDADDDLKYATKRGGPPPNPHGGTAAWIVETVDTAGDTGRYTSIGLSYRAEGAAPPPAEPPPPPSGHGGAPPPPPPPAPPPAY